VCEPQLHKICPIVAGPNQSAFYGGFFSSVKVTQLSIPMIAAVLLFSFSAVSANGTVMISTGVWHSRRFLNCTCRWNTLQRCSSRSGYPSCCHCSSLWCLVSLAAEGSARLIRLIHVRPLLIDCKQVYLDTCARSSGAHQ
jgi:hypothetical protein